MYEMNNSKKITEKIEELEKMQRDNLEISINDIKEIEKSLDKLDFTENSIEYLLRHKLLKLRKYASNDNNEQLTKWDLFVIDIANLEGFEKVKELTLLINNKKDKNITTEELKEIENMYSEILPTLHTNLNEYERDRAVREFNKKIRLFNNRLSRVIEDDFGAWIKQLRLSKGYSLKDLESISGVTASYIHRIESGSRKTPSVPIAERLAIGLGVKPDEFLKKLNIATTGTSIDADLPLAQALAVTGFTINGEKVNIKQKNELINLVNKILSAKWNDQTKVSDSIEIMSLIDKLKKAIPCE